jgi:hypothetical protein
MGDTAPAIGPGGCIDWTGLDVPAIWAMLASGDSALSAEQTTAWNRTYDLLDSHARNLRTLRDNLAERWPPGRSEASAVFLEYLDKLIESVNPTSYASSSNALVLSDLTDTLAVARAKVAPLHEQWQAAAASGTADPKVQAGLNAQAAAIMAGTDEEVYQHGQRFVVPAEYEPPVGAVEPTRPFPLETRSKPQAVRPLPPASSGSVQPTNSQRTISAGGDAPLLDSLPGPSTGSGTVLSPTPATNFVDTPAGRALAPGGVIGHAAVESSIHAVRRTRMAESSKDIGRTLRPPVSGGHDEPSSIGPDPLRSPHNQPLRSNIPTDEQREPLAGTGGVYGSGPRSQKYRRQPSGEAYVEWPVDRGIPPVLMPPPEPERHDPGPGVIGIDR